ncbi:MAG: Epoxyqueuosine reductase [Lentisphaerae bacterium ADurb.Bin242]|nr:MAG: Epoxyqueuosine reductase [Lentisphaerae bacterium ADurb.Bin242]
MNEKNGLYQADTPETMEIKRYALETLRADLVGIANIERFAGAPEKMSPQGILPSARSVIVMAVHHPDAAIELGGLKHPQEIGPYCIQYHMNWRLDDMSYRMGIFLEKLGWKAVPIVSSNIWRYRGYKDLKEQFAPDVSHMHAAVAAGLAEFGYSGLAITPEFGARQRYVTIITDAVLTPSPLLDPGSVCDNCMICRKECRSGALSKEIDGWNVVEIEGRQYRYAKKNLWRCSWGEHFDIDLDLPIPEHVDEKVIMEATVKYGRRGGEMGSCLRYCVPKSVRYWDRDYTNAPRRRKFFQSNPEGGTAFHRGLFEEVRALGAGWGVDHVVVSDASELREKLDIDIQKLMPGAIRAVSMITVRNQIDEEIASPEMHLQMTDQSFTRIVTQSAYDIVRLLEKFGFSSCQHLGFPDEKLAAVLTVPVQGRDVRVHTLLTNAPLPTTSWTLPAGIVRPGSRKQLTQRLRREFELHEGDLFAIAPAERIDALVPHLRKIYDGEVELISRNKAKTPYAPYDPVITENIRRVAGCSDYLAGAKSVIVIGLRMPAATVDITARTPAEAAGPYVFAQYETIIRLRLLAWNLISRLEEAGFKATMTDDLHRTGSFCCNPRGEFPDAFSNVFAAAAAGLGSISHCGALVNPEFASNARYLAIITNAELEYNEVRRTQLANCKNCKKTCISSCKTAAFEDNLQTIEIDGVPQHFHKIDVNRCNWAKRWSLVGSEGNQYTGWNLDEPFPENFNGDALAAAIRKLPQIKKLRSCNFEQCLLNCPNCRPQ